MTNYPKIETPFCLHDDVVRPEWIDGNGHMGALNYNVAFIEPMNKFFSMLGLGHAYREETGCATFLLDWRVQYLREVMEGTPLRFEVRLLDVSDKVMHYFAEMHAGEDRYLAATSEALEIQMDLSTRKPVTYPPELQSYLDKMLAAHKALPWPKQAAGTMGIRRKSTSPPDRSRVLPMKLYASTGTGSVAPQAMLQYVGADYDIVWIDYDKEEHRQPEFLAVNPRGQLPALVLADGTVITESAAIMLHLADCYPQTDLIGKPGSAERAQTYRWTTFLATNSYEDYLRYAYPYHYTVDKEGEPYVSASGNEAMNRSWGILNDALRSGPCLVGDRVTIADIYMAMILTWHPDPDGLAKKFPNLRSALENTLKLKGVSEVFRENELI